MISPLVFFLFVMSATGDPILFIIVFALVLAYQVPWFRDEEIGED